MTYTRMFLTTTGITCLIVAGAGFLHAHNQAKHDYAMAFIFLGWVASIYVWACLAKKPICKCRARRGLDTTK